jgi:hypothetical protein
MSKFVIENGILKAYIGRDSVVVVPEGVTHIGGVRRGEDTECPPILRGDSLGYKAFYCNKHVRELYLPDSTVEIGFKSLEHCSSLEVLSFSSNMKTFGCNAIVGCDALKKIIYRGNIYEFSCIETPGQTPDLDVVYCTDGEIRFGKDRDYYIETLYFPGTRAEWDSQIKPDDWRNRRCRKIVCTDEI